MPIISRGFRGRRQSPEVAGRIPPGQHLVGDFPVLSAGPTPAVGLDRWELAVDGAVARPRRWTWPEFRALEREPVTADIHCVTTWSKLDTTWEGVSLDLLLGELEPAGTHLVAECHGDYTTNLPIAEVTGGRAWVVDTYDGAPLAAEHGGPARLLVPHLYLWKSAKWVRRLRVVTADQPGFWESLGYHNHGDPWKEERYWGD
ncbi:MAG: oxidoreductase molybdopterin binding protein [Chloroflexi bacterium]|jgi:DMSO/TMAO reductase YedYZ molybdopterin-dependent catalytic subunit|nr:oxidoreductase molybdopterin binding protein [Chloroflexota bacterium]